MMSFGGVQKLLVIVPIVVSHVMNAVKFMIETELWKPLLAGILVLTSAFQISLLVWEWIRTRRQRMWQKKPNLALTDAPLYYQNNEIHFGKTNCSIAEVQ